MQKIYEKLQTYATLKYVRTFLIIVFIIGGLGFPLLLRLAGNDVSMDIPDTHLHYTPAVLSGILENMGERGRSWYVWISLGIDILFPLTIFLTFSTAMILLLPKAAPEQHLLPAILCIPLLGAVFDILENLALIILMLSYPSLPVGLAWLASVFTVLKWLMVSAETLILLAALTARQGKKK